MPAATGFPPGSAGPGRVPVTAGLSRGRDGGPAAGSSPAGLPVQGPGFRRCQLAQFAGVRPGLVRTARFGLRADQRVQSSRPVVHRQACGQAVCLLRLGEGAGGVPEEQAAPGQPDAGPYGQLGDADGLAELTEFHQELVFVLVPGFLVPYRGQQPQRLPAQRGIQPVLARVQQHGQLVGDRTDAGGGHGHGQCLGQALARPPGERRRGQSQPPGQVLEYASRGRPGARFQPGQVAGGQAACGQCGLRQSSLTAQCPQPLPEGGLFQHGDLL